MSPATTPLLTATIPASIWSLSPMSTRVERASSPVGSVVERWTQSKCSTSTSTW
jgi:hypothetical protein